MPTAMRILNIIGVSTHRFRYCLSTQTAVTGRPSYHPAVMLKVYIYDYLNRIQSSRRLERECQRNVELMWLTGRLVRNCTYLTT